MKLLSFTLPGLSGLARGCGRIEVAEGELTEELGGDGKIGWRKPPGSSRVIFLDASTLLEGRITFREGISARELARP